MKKSITITIAAIVVVIIFILAILLTISETKRGLPIQQQVNIPSKIELSVAKESISKEFTISHKFSDNMIFFRDTSTDEKFIIETDRFFNNAGGVKFKARLIEKTPSYYVYDGTEYKIYSVEKWIE